MEVLIECVNGERFCVEVDVEGTVLDLKRSVWEHVNSGAQNGAPDDVAASVTLMREGPNGRTELGADSDAPLSGLAISAGDTLFADFCRTADVSWACPRRYLEDKGCDRMALSPCKQHCAVASTYSEGIHVVDLVSGHIDHIVPDAMVRCLVLTDVFVIYAKNTSRTVHFFRRDRASVRVPTIVATGFVHSMSAIPSREELVVCTPGSVSIYSETGYHVCTVQNMSRRAVVSPNGVLIAGYSEPLGFRVCSMPDMGLVHELRDSSLSGDWVVFSEDSKRIATSSQHYTVRVWSADTGVVIQQITTLNAARGMCFSPQGFLFISSVSGMTVQVEIATGLTVHSFSSHSYEIAVCPNDSSVLLGKSLGLEVIKIPTVINREPAATPVLQKRFSHSQDAECCCIL